MSKNLSLFNGLNNENFITLLYEYTTQKGASNLTFTVFRKLLVTRLEDDYLRGHRDAKPYGSDFDGGMQ